jgi:hypothetical protein
MPPDELPVVCPRPDKGDIHKGGLGKVECFEALLGEEVVEFSSLFFGRKVPPIKLREGQADLFQSNRNGLRGIFSNKEGPEDAVVIHDHRPYR